MKRSSFSILYYIRESRIKKDGTAGIEVKITINGERCFFSTGKNIKVENWDKVKQIAKGKFVNHKQHKMLYNTKKPPYLT